MAGMTCTRAFLVWLLIIATETIHGILRTVLLVPGLGDLPSRQIGVLVGSVLIFVITLLTINWLETKNTWTRLLIGAGWVGFTVTFELVLGVFVMGANGDRIISDYDFRNGGYMLLGLLCMLVSPVIAHAVRNKR